MNNEQRLYEDLYAHLVLFERGIDPGEGEAVEEFIADIKRRVLQKQMDAYQC